MHLIENTKLSVFRILLSLYWLIESVCKSLKRFRIQWYIFLYNSFLSKLIFKRSNNFLFSSISRRFLFILNQRHRNLILNFELFSIIINWMWTCKCFWNGLITRGYFHHCHWFISCFRFNSLNIIPSLWPLIIDDELRSGSFFIIYLKTSENKLFILLAYLNIRFK